MAAPRPKRRRRLWYALALPPGRDVTERGRPAWLRLASRIRSAAYRLLSPIERAWRGRNAELLPPFHLRMYYYGTGRLEVFARQCADARLELTSRGLRPTDRVLDIGSGIGNLPIGLAADYLTLGYDGIEINPEAVACCQSVITPRHPQIRFHGADLTSTAYNPAGRVSAARRSDFHSPTARSTSSTWRRCSHDARGSEALRR